MIKPGIYSGSVWHNRLAPKTHRFNYTMLMIAQDLQHIEIPHNRFSILALRDRDHFPNSEQSLLDNIRELMPDPIRQQDHQVMIISQMAHWGFAFNPISFFVIQNTTEILGLIIEVHNTPWGQRHFYPIFEFDQEQNKYTAQFDKAMHVSPFLPMDFRYHFSMTLSEHNGLAFSLENWRKDEKVFAAGVHCQHQELSLTTLTHQLIKHPFSPHKTVAAIYWQAFKLWAKGLQFYSHPKWNQS